MKPLVSPMILKFRVVSSQANGDLSAPWKAKTSYVPSPGCYFTLDFVGCFCWINVLAIHNILLILIPKWLFSPTEAKFTKPHRAIENISPWLFIIKRLLL